LNNYKDVRNKNKDLNCKYCSKACNKYGLKNHEIYCKLNPNPNFISRVGANNPHYGKKGSNHYIKAASEGREIVMSEETRYKLGDGNRNKIWTTEEKDNHKIVMAKTASNLQIFLSKTYKS
jgi:hypothetical protein